MKKTSRRRKILIIRLHAVGDAALTLPACRKLKLNYPEYELHYLTTENIKGLVASFGIFDSVFEIGKGFEIYESGYSSIKKKINRLISSFKTGLKLKKNNYDTIIDLQNNKYSRVVRRISGVKNYSEFDRYSAKPHSIRVIDTMKQAGFKDINNDFNLNISDSLKFKGKKILKDNGWDGNKKIVLLNPAGMYETRMWGDENYLELGGLLVRAGYMLLLAGTDKMKNKVARFKDQFGSDIIDLTGITRLEEIPGILFHTNGIVSDDSGLFHITWAMGKPGVLLLGATRADWTCQPGGHTVCLNSGDLECGNCMKEICKWGDTRCLKRYKSAEVFNKLIELMNRVN